MTEERAILKDIKTNFILCPHHCRWESFTQESEFDITCSRGKKIHGFLVPFVRKPLFPQKEPISPRRSWQSLSKPRPPADREGISFDTFMIYLEESYPECAGSLVQRVLDRTKLLSIKEGNFMLVKLPEVRQKISFNLRGLKTYSAYGFHNIQKETFFVDLPSWELDKVKFPSLVSEQIELTAERLVHSYTGRKIRINKNYYRGFKLLYALANFPYEANIFAVANEIPIPEFSLSEHDNSDVYNSVCRFLNVKSFPSIRKAFDRNPLSLIQYTNLHEMGFRDTNIIMEIIKACNAKEGSRDYTTLTKYLSCFNTFTDEENPYIFFCGYSIPLRGERATWNALNRAPGFDEGDRYDIAVMFRDYFTELKSEERQLVVKDGFSRRTHDTLTKITHSLQYKNHIFNYRPDQKALEDEIDGYKFLLPPDSASMHALGAAMHNCVFSYWEKVLKGSCTIVYAIKDDIYELCIETGSDRTIYQARTDYNGKVAGTIRAVFDKWCKKHNLTCNMYI